MLNKKSVFFIQYIVFFLSCMLPRSLYAVEEAKSIYTIQIGSYHDVEAADKQFNTTAQKLNKKKLDYLRVEKIGKYYTVRLGKFDHHSSAKMLLESVRYQFSSPIIMNAYFIEDRIVSMYQPQDEVIDGKTATSRVQKDMLKDKRREIEPPLIEKNDRKTLKKRTDHPREDKMALIADLVYKKDYTGALGIIQEEITVQPHHHELNAWYGTVLLKTNRPDEALEYLEEAVEMSPSVPDYHNVLGYCFFFLHMPDKAIDAFNKVLSLNPEHIDAVTGLGIIYAKKGNIEKAFDMYHKLKSLDEASAHKLLKMIEDPLL